MARVKRGTTTHARHAKVIKAAKGYYGRRKNTFRTATQAVDKARQYAYRDRRVRKREFRALWIQRINAAARLHGLTYSQMMGGLIKAVLRLTGKCLLIWRCMNRRPLRPWSNGQERQARGIPALFKKLQAVVLTCICPTMRQGHASNGLFI